MTDTLLTLESSDRETAMLSDDAIILEALMPSLEPVATSETKDIDSSLRNDAEFSNRLKREVLTRLPRRAHSTAPKFVLKQQWEGTVIELGEGEFLARLRDLTDPARESEEAAFDNDDVMVEDAGLLRPGATFYWSIGYEDTAQGRRRQSVIRFRRLPAWSRTELKEVEDEAATLKALFTGPRADRVTG